MSSEDVSRVSAFRKKASELDKKGHLLRAAEILGRGAEAARTLGPDNFVMADMLQYQATTLEHYIGTMVATGCVDRGALAAHRAECVALLSTVVAALDRRRVAGTLLEGKCTAVEEAWHNAFLQDVGFSPADAAI